MPPPEARPRIRFLIDNCVPDSVGRALRDAGHNVTLLRDIMAADSPDPLVATVSLAIGAVLVSNDKDFDTMANRVGIGKKRMRRFGRISLRCSEPQAAGRIGKALGLIEQEFLLAQDRPDERIFIEIGDSYIRTNR